jgi:hypothetical protein
VIGKREKIKLTLTVPSYPPDIRSLPLRYNVLTRAVCPRFQHRIQCVEFTLCIGGGQRQSVQHTSPSVILTLEGAIDSGTSDSSPRRVDNWAVPLVSLSCSTLPDEEEETRSNSRIVASEDPVTIVPFTCPSSSTSDFGFESEWGAGKKSREAIPLG